MGVEQSRCDSHQLSVTPTIFLKSKRTPKRGWLLNIVVMLTQSLLPVVPFVGGIFFNLGSDQVCCHCGVFLTRSKLQRESTQWICWAPENVAGVCCAHENVVGV